MAKTIEDIPEGARWQMATQGLTGAFLAISKAMKDAVGQEGFEAFNGPFWFQAGKGAKPFADSLGAETKTAGDLENITHLLAKAAMGPEFAFNIVESTPDKCVGTTTECPWHKRWQEQGGGFDPCGAGHQNWGAGAIESLNPNFTFKLLKNMTRGDSHCEWVIERKK